ncbi:hypothetical protein DPMN_081394 [Dreissena polymorpha]|uniref:Uncharacterized protein n=1 Tax=Dreissena polymorpha TaxID=45954 RepID=A0A9D4BFW2_DREPO|nr:hypothetical protein DPMN_081393 [Dreissena polymorpha]KAH3693955.1 hypothetical protein DPMN_081394 [Dreissena polymorpha]
MISYLPQPAVRRARVDRCRSLALIKTVAAFIMVAVVVGKLAKMKLKQTAAFRLGFEDVARIATRVRNLRRLASVLRVLLRDASVRLRQTAKYYVVHVHDGLVRSYMTFSSRTQP